MILLDTAVVTEGMRRQPAESVRRWLDAQRMEELFLCTPVLAELQYGIGSLPRGGRRIRLEKAIRQIEEAFANRILIFDRAAAQEYARFVTQRDRLGRATSTMDAMIAAIAKVHGAAIATRNIYCFDDAGLELVDPFSQVSP